MKITAYSLGATEEVTGSKHFLDIDGNLIQIDCGAFQGGKKQDSDLKNRTFDVDTEHLKAVVLTHGHFDHVGLLPLLTKNGYKGNIYSTSATRDLANLVIMDSAKIQASDYEAGLAAARRKGNKKGEGVPGPIYTEEDCVNTMCQLATIPYYRKTPLLKNVDVQLYDAGHILGSSMVELTVKEDVGFFSKLLRKEGQCTRILYTGDLGRPEKPIIKKPDTNVEAPDYIYLESTYGNRRHQGRDVAIEHFAKVIRETIARGGKVLIPSFAIERTQEILYYLNVLLQEHKIPKVPVYVDSPMATNATGIFRVHSECYNEEIYKEFLDKHKNPFQFNNLTFVSSNQESMKLDKKRDPMIIIAADGMCEAGRITHHLAANIEKAKNTVLIVGYMAENTLGRHLLDGDKEVKILSSLFQVNAKIEKIDAFSAHADYQEEIDWLNEIDTSRLKKIFLVHGDPESQAFLRTELIKAGYKNVEIVKANTLYNL